VFSHQQISHFGARHPLRSDAERWWRRGWAAGTLHVPSRQAALQRRHLLGVLGGDDSR
jgi:hypothetical protein